MSHFNVTSGQFPRFQQPATVSFSTFKSAFDMAMATELKVTDGEKAMLADMASRMDVAGQAQALELLLARGYPNTYLQVARAARGAPITVKGFRDGVQMAMATELSMSKDEISALSNAFRRLPAQGKREALAFLQERNLVDLYQACAERAPFTPVSVDSFKDAVNMAAATELKITDDERSMLVDSFGRLDAAGQGAALDFLLTRNLTSTYEAAAAVSGPARTSLKGFQDGVNMASATELRVTGEELGTLVDAFRRLNRNDQDQALQFLAKWNKSDIYAACVNQRW